MDLKPLFHRFDGRCRLLIHSLLSGMSGVRAARRAFNRQRASDPDYCLRPFLEILCQDEACVDNHTHALITKPLVCLFPESFKRNLLCFLHLVHPVLPRDRVGELLHCVSQESTRSPWICALTRQLHRDLGDPGTDKLFSSHCGEKLRELCYRFKGVNGKGSWATCFDGHANLPIHSQTESTEDFSKKRKSELLDIEEDAEVDVQQSKRMKMDHLPAREDTVGDQLAREDAGLRESPSPQPDQKLEAESTSAQHSAPEEPSKSLPDHIKSVVPLIKELLETEVEWDESRVLALGLLDECNHAQVEVLCGEVGLSAAPEQTLPQFCSCLLAVAPGLSHATATILIQNLLLSKVLSLGEAASRCLMTAATSLCRRYPRPTCQGLIQPLLQDTHTGGAQAELLCRLVEDCLEPQHRLLVFQMTLTGEWSEGLLSIIHTLLDSKLELSEEVFSQFISQLGSQSPHFTKSMKFAKMTLTVLTKYQAHVNASCQHTLSSCLSLNETFLKKSLLAALRRITSS